jgi:hypothetical protein
VIRELLNQVFHPLFLINSQDNLDCATQCFRCERIAIVFMPYGGALPSSPLDTFLGSCEFGVAKRPRQQSQSCGLSSREPRRYGYHATLPIALAYEPDGPMKCRPILKTSNP